MKKNKTNPLWFYLVLFSLPIIIIISTELILRGIKYGDNYDTFVTISDQFDDLLFFNPKLPKKYFSNNSHVPSVIPDGFEKNKRENGFRIFVLGGSTTAGFPYPTNAAFSRQLKRKLEITYRDKFFEVINLGISAVNSNTIRDIIDDVLEEKPDLIIIYAGHNEYYGADGVVNRGILNYNPAITSVYNSLREFKIYQLISNFIKSVIPKENSQSKTLMAEMAGESLVEHNSDLFYDGLNQFEENLEVILSECKNKGVEVFLCEIISNNMQEPLEVSIKKNGEAEKLFLEGINNNNKEQKEKLLFQAKEKDAFRFRAPTEINEIIINKSDEFGFTFIPVESEFKEKSKQNISGFDLFVDHLHPNIDGHKLIADQIYNFIIKENLLGNINTNLDSTTIERTLKSTFPFTRIDTVFSEMRIEILLNSHPFKEKKSLNQILDNYNSYNDRSSELASKAVLGELSWESAHVKLADEEYQKNNFERFFREYWCLIEDKPFVKYNYKYVSEKLIASKQYNFATSILFKYNNKYEDYFSTALIGKIYLEIGNYKSAIMYLTKSLNYNKNQAEVYYNLSQSYYRINDISNALNSINNCISINPKYKDAQKIKEFLSKKSLLSN